MLGFPRSIHPPRHYAHSFTPPLSPPAGNLPSPQAADNPFEDLPPPDAATVAPHAVGTDPRRGQSEPEPKQLRKLQLSNYHHERRPHHPRRIYDPVRA
jgi:hypothetical protein